MKLFGTAGIRGVTNIKITPQLALDIGKAYGTLCGGKIAVARDTRYGSEMLESALISGLQSTGVEVLRLGIVPLPVFARFVADFADGGVIVTGSHTPPQISGLVIVDSLGRDIYHDMEREIERIYHRKEYRYAQWDRIKDTVYKDAMEHYIKFIEKKVKNVSGFKIALDVANGAAAGIWNRILEYLDITVRCINCTRKHIPSRPSEPRKNTLTELAKITKGMDLGAGTDVDADRVVFIAQNGDAVSEDVVGAIFAKRFARGKIVTPINSSMLIEEVASREGFEVIYCPVGPPEMAEAILKTSATFAYEETGKYLFPPDTLWGDSLLSILKILEIMDREGKTLDELAKEFPEYHQMKVAVPVNGEMKYRIVEMVSEEIERKLIRNAVNIVKTDGIKIIFKDAWLLIRASGTEDVIRVFSDAKTEERARELVEYGKNIVLRFISSFQQA